MARCLNDEIGSMLHAYELGLLDEDDTNRVEVHLLECPRCNRLFLEFLEAARTLRSEGEIQPVLETLSAGEPSGEAVAAGSETAGDGGRKPRVIRYLMAAAAVIILLVLKPWNLRFETDDPVVAAGSGIAVMPFEFAASQADTGRVATVIENLLLTDLSASKFLQVVHGDQVANVSRWLGSRDSTLDVTERDEAAFERFGIRWILDGSILQLEPQIVVTAQMTDLIDHRVVLSLREIGNEGESVFAVVDRLAARIRQGVLTPVEIQSEFDPALAEVTTQSAEAYRWYLEGVELYGRRRIAEAEDAYRRAIRYDSTFAMGWYCLAFHGVPNAVENAVRFSKQASHMEKLYIYSLEASRNGDEARAVELLKELVERYPNEKIAWMELAYIVWQNRQYDEAVYYLKQSLMADPLYLDALDLLAYVYDAMGDFESALATINEAVALEPDEPNPYDSRGEILAANGRLDEAVVNYEKAIALKPDFTEYMTTFTLGQLYVYQGRYDSARDAYRQVIAGGDAEMRSLARGRLSLIPMYQGKISQASTELEDAFAADRIDNSAAVSPGSAAFKYFILSRLQLKDNDREGARASLREAVALAERARPLTHDTYSVHYAHALAMAGDTGGARTVIQELKDRIAQRGENLDPVHKANGLLAYVAGDYHQAIEHLQSIHDSDWLGFDIRYTLARAYLSLEQYEEAAEELRGALTDFSDQKRLSHAFDAVEAYYYLALAEENLGKSESAIEHYEEFLRIWSNADPSLNLLNEAREKLARIKNSS